MKRSYIYTVILLAILSCFGCTAEDSAYGEDNSTWESIGNIVTSNVSSENGYNIRLDNGITLIPIYNMVLSIPVTDDQRVLAWYNYINDSGTDANRKEHEVRLKALLSVPTKEPVKQSFIQEMETNLREDSLGYDPVNIVGKPWLGNKYLNMKFRIKSKTAGAVSHLINIVYDDTFEDHQVARLTLRHNGYDDVPVSGDIDQVQWSEHIISFDLSSIPLPEGQDWMDIELVWEDYGSNLEERITNVFEGIYSPGNEQGPDPQLVTFDKYNISSYMSIISVE